MIKVGDLVKTTTQARKSLDGPAVGYGHVTKIVGKQIAYVCWFKKGFVKPYNVVWLEKVG